MIARVFPRKTSMTPDDPYAFYEDRRYGISAEPPMYLPEDITEVHVSVTFTWDIPYAEYLVKAWEKRTGLPVKIGGPALGAPGGNFVPGMYLKKGPFISSRGCPNCCWFCSAWIREGREIRELPITEGINLLDDNLLVCSDQHIKDVFTMMKQQKGRKEFTGGLEAARLKDWHVDLIYDLKPKQIFFAYDTPDDYDPLVITGRKLLSAGFTTASHSLRCYVLIGYPGDTIDKADHRLTQAINAGFVPMAMLYRDDSGITNLEWDRFQKQWARPAIINTKLTNPTHATVESPGVLSR